MSAGLEGLTAFGSGLWLAQGPIVSVFGFRYPTLMAIAALNCGGLFIWSPVALTPDLARATDALGPVRAIVAPNSLHHLYVQAWKERFPAARTFAAPGLANKRADIGFDGELSDAPDSLWTGQIDQAIVRGNLITTEAVFFHRASRTVLVTDLIQQFPSGWFQGWRELVARLDGMIAPEPQMPRKFRLAFRDRAAAKAGFATIVSWPSEKLVMAHGTPLQEGSQAAIRKAFSWLA
jgi:Domain of unknown function (DUF4336)